ncbi:hypothetical protein [Amycolatopsis azurea]|uniref:Ig-like domain-containing protein n=1 Tax=Amycolatopsis azurea DSM 43854 TaxID=1238180 RepID=M2QP53_9PSEU|nr:hypothetical protein [Amycolatopsis azurea]EMD28441.1 hypothetical protein C791_1115 [Amycolatopsis azurea DSM 43854]OOC06650.1 hypothetical protein B0293_11460 [Amycolatopsis azurea DSM 43854]
MWGNKSAMVMAVAALGMAVAPAAASAETEPSLRVYPTEVRPNEIFGTGIGGGCDSYSAVTSPGFAGPVELVAVGGDRENLWGNGPASGVPGTYTATATCDGKTLTTQFTVLDYAPPSWGLGPREVAPGGEISGGSDTIYGCPGGPEGAATSPGFAEPLQWTRGGNFGRFSGTTTVVTTPGTYTATLKCKGTPIPGEIEFTVVAP